jgi:hypothetical protein
MFVKHKGLPLNHNSKRYQLNGTTIGRVQTTHWSVFCILDLPSNHVVGRNWGNHFHFIPNNIQKQKVQLIQKLNILIYLNVNRVFIIHYENIF